MIIKPEISRLLTDGGVFYVVFDSLKLSVKFPVCKHVYFSGERKFKGLIRFKESKIKG